MRGETRKCLFDIVEACHLLRDFTAGKTLADYSADPMLRSAVERQFEIIGEALRQALPMEPDLAERITNSHRIVAFRNRLIHGCASIADDVVWGVLETSLPKLIEEVERLLAEDDTDLGARLGKHARKGQDATKFVRRERASWERRGKR